MADAKLFDVVRVSSENLLGEIIELRGDRASIQVYEDTVGLKIGERVSSCNAPLSVELGPGLLGGIYDGIQRPLTALGERIKRGTQAGALELDRKWTFIPKLKKGAAVTGGDIIGVVEENEVFTHKIMVPPDTCGVISKIHGGGFSVEETVCTLQSPDGGETRLTMRQSWPVRKERPYISKRAPSEPLITGQRVIDSLFPIAKGGAAAIPGPFGSGKTVVQHQIAKFADADIIVYVGCGERGNEMTDVLKEFPELTDPRTGQSLMKRTVLIANTSDMPVAAREASIYTGITIAEYFRDMGYSVAVMADSSSRWAEALREMSGRLEEMPGEEGYPAYLSSRLAGYYERSGVVKCLGADGREGSVTAISAVSPPGGDLSEPVSQATLRIVKVFWGLSARLAYRRHFPAIDWSQSYSLYKSNLEEYYRAEISREFSSYTAKAARILQKEAAIEEIAALVGKDSLSAQDLQILECAKAIREDFLHQNAYEPRDAYTPPKRQFEMLKRIIDKGVSFSP